LVGYGLFRKYITSLKEVSIGENTLAYFGQMSEKQTVFLVTKDEKTYIKEFAPV
jgi:hypothetical protein